MIAAPAPWMMRKTISQASAPEPVGVAPQRAEADGEDDHADDHHLAVAGDVGEPAAEGEERRERTAGSR